MHTQGISYDTGFVLHGQNSRPQFELEQVAQDLRAVREDLHCTAVRVIGGDPHRIELAAGIAVDLGLEVWFSPYPLELSGEEMLALFADCAERAERLKKRGGEVVFVTGAELSLMNPGFLPGDSTEARLQLLAQPDRAREVIAGVGERVNAFLAQAVAVVRARFAGRVTYASVPLDRVDWTPFDIVSMDIYRSAAIADRFPALLAQGLRSPTLQGKPVVVTEFGCPSYAGGAARGAQGLDVVEHDPRTRAPLRLKEPLVRDEAGQAATVRELLEVFDSVGVSGAFLFAFALSSYPHRPEGDPLQDLDLASYSIVRLFEDGSWEPKAAFAAVADFYASR